MSINSCTLDLTCDNKECNCHGIVSDKTFEECIDIIKQDGWIINGNKVICPYCNKENEVNKIGRGIKQSISIKFDMA